MALLKTEVPRFAPGESLGAKVNRMYRYLQDLQRGLDFVLSHLGAENLNGNGFTLPVLSADGKEELGSLGAAGDGVGLMHGGWGLRVTANGIEVTEDGRTWGPLETGGTGEAPDLSGYVPTSRKVNNKALSSDISLNASDVGARPSNWTPTASDVGAVKKTGDTMTGNLIINGSTDVGAELTALNNKFTGPTWLTNLSTSSIAYTKFAGMVTISNYANIGTAIPSNTWTTLGTLPSGYRPSRRLDVACTVGYNANLSGVIRITTAGNIDLWSYNALTTSTAYLSFTVSYPV